MTNCNSRFFWCVKPFHTLYSFMTLHEHFFFYVKIGSTCHVIAQTFSSQLKKLFCSRVFLFTLQFVWRERASAVLHVGQHLGGNTRALCGHSAGHVAAQLKEIQSKEGKGDLKQWEGKWITHVYHWKNLHTYCFFYIVCLVNWLPCIV